MKRWPVNTEEITLNDVDALINKGRWHRALRIVRTNTFELKYMKNQQYWFLRALAELLAGKVSMLSYCQRRAGGCPDYAEWIEGDFLRDHALFLIRARRYPEAAACLDKAKKYHASPDRLAVLTMSFGALAYATGYYQDALQLFEGANRLWYELKIRHEPANDQWIKNCRFRLLKAQARLGRIDSKLVGEIKEYDPSRLRRWRASLIWLLGAFGNRLDDWAIYTVTRIRYPSK